MANKLISSKQLQLALYEFKNKYDLKVDAKQDTLTAGSNIVISNGIINVSSNGSPQGKVLTSNGSGGATWENASGGGGVYTVTANDVVSVSSDVYTFTSDFKAIVESGNYTLKINGSMIDPNDTNDYFYYPFMSETPDFLFATYNAEYPNTFYVLHFVEDNGDLSLSLITGFRVVDLQANIETNTNVSQGTLVEALGYDSDGDLVRGTISGGSSVEANPVGSPTSNLNTIDIEGTIYQVKQFNLTDTTYLASVVFNYADSSSETVECNYSIVGSNIYLTNVE